MLEPWGHEALGLGPVREVIMPRIEFVQLHDDDSETVHHLPAEWAICSTCSGDGKHSRGLGAYTQSEWDEQGPEFQEDYLAGNYDSQCEDCNGSGKVLAVDRNVCHPETLAAYDAQVEEDAAYAAEVAHEVKMGY